MQWLISSISLFWRVQLFTALAVIWLFIQGVRALRATERIAREFEKLPIDDANHRTLLMILREAGMIRVYLSAAVVLLAIIADKIVLFS